MTDQHLVKGGGPVEELVGWIKVIWRLVEGLGVTLSPRWQRRNELMMQRADELSKEDTEWELRPVLGTGFSTHGADRLTCRTWQTARRR